MLSDEAFQKLLFDLFCLWHDVRRHYDPPITHTEEEKMQKVGSDTAPKNGDRKRILGEAKC
jgi:hypothetical protein